MVNIEKQYEYKKTCNIFHLQKKYLILYVNYTSSNINAKNIIYIIMYLEI